MRAATDPNSTPYSLWGVVWQKSDPRSQQQMNATILLPFEVNVLYFVDVDVCRVCRVREWFATKLRVMMGLSVRWSQSFVCQ